MSLQPLNKILRNKLESSIKEARDIAETAARAVIDQLGVGETKPYEHLNAEEKELRRKLRIHGRQLGDNLCPSKQMQEVDRLCEEVAYQHWHRMLFARFLAENNLLMYPDPDEPIAITLEECEDLAPGEGASNGWELAARFAACMLPQIFQIDSPVFLLKLHPEHQQRLEQLLINLSPETFHAADSLGWVYQFWQTKRKKEINDSEVKIDARELPAVTQLFTEPYMVDFLLDNTLGAWWVAQQLTPQDLVKAKNEEDLRKKVSLPRVALKYLRFVKDENNQWSPAAGTFDKWPKKLAELKALDPCCGSGHFLVSLLLMLIPMRMKLEGLSASEAIDTVLRENIYGLEIDQRCVELAAFNLALTAWRYPESGGYRPLPKLNVASSGLSVGLAKEEWKQLGLGKKNFSLALDWMHDIFMDAPILGSLIHPAKTDAAKIVEWESLSSTLEDALNREQSYEQHEVAIVAHGLARAATLLAGQYHLVITNVPYLSSGKQCKKLQEFCERHYPAAKSDLATVFLDRCLEFCTEGGTSSVVLPQNWLFLTSYKKFREKLLKNDTWHLIARLGEGGFDSSAAAGAFAIMLSISRGNTSGYYGEIFSKIKTTHLMRGLDVSSFRNSREKSTALLTAEIKSIPQTKQLDNPDARVALEEEIICNLLNTHSHSHHGLVCGDRPRMCVNFWEIYLPGDQWIHYCGTVKGFKHYGGKEIYLRWQNGKGAIKELKGATNLETHTWNNKGIIVSAMRSLPVTLYTGMAFDNNTSLITANNVIHLPAIWCFCSSPAYNKAVRQIDQSLKVTNATLVKVPFDLDHWAKVAAEKYPKGLPKPFSDDPTQWIFHGHPCGSVMWDQAKKHTTHGPLRRDTSVLQVAVARLLGYRWPAELDGTMELAEQQREWVQSCETLLHFAEETGIICLPSVRGKASAADRLLDLLANAYGASWSNEKLSDLLKQAGYEDKTLDSWLRDKFFVQHCELFHQRPFIWQIWDGLHDGFAVLVNYHKFDYKNLETLIYTYLGDWINRQKEDLGHVDGANERLAAAENLKKKLELILQGEKPYDIFIRWKPLDKQPIGWNPDLNDGVRLNIRPFMSVPDVKKKGAGVLREKPGIKWDKDRGKDVETAPWFSDFKGDRNNDHHLTLAEKRASQDRILESNT